MEKINVKSNEDSLSKISDESTRNESSNDLIVQKKKRKHFIYSKQ